MMRRMSLGVALCFSTALGCGDDTGPGNNNTADAGSDAGSSTSTGGSNTTSTGTGTGSSTSTSTGTSAVTDDGGAGGDGGAFTISSPDFEDGAPLPEQNTCEGEAFGAGISPELEWSGAPAGAKRYALVFKDLTIEASPGDYPQRAFHWIAWDIPTTVTGIPQGLGAGEFPEALEGGKQFRGGPPQAEPEFFGPCPSWMSVACPGEPRVTDDYAFVLYAFDDEDLDYPEPVDGVHYAIALADFFEANMIASTVLTATSNAQPTNSPAPCPLPVPGDAGADSGDAAFDGGESASDGGDAAVDGGESTADGGDIDAEAPVASDASADASGDASDGG